MPKLWLKFKDESGEERRIAVKGDVFTIGRHSENRLTIRDSRLSREHVRIERRDGDFVVSDSGSSNGTLINGANLFEPTVLNDGDIIDLGRAVDIAVEMSISDADQAAGAVAVEQFPEAPMPANSMTAAPVSMGYSPAAETNGIPMSFFLIAPLLGIIVLVIAGGLIWMLSGGDKTAVADADDDFAYSTNRDDDPPENSKTDIPIVKNVTSPQTQPLSNASNTGDSFEVNSNKDLSGTGKIEQNGAAFLRRIAQNDPKAFLTGDQAQRVSTKVKQLGKSALPDNINSARKSAVQIRALAVSKNLKPQFLAVAAIAKLGSGRGDVLRTAQSIAEVFDKLGPHIGNERADDALLMIAAYDQGAAGDVMKMRNMLQDLANRTPESSRAIRSIWFLEKNGKITKNEFDDALTFLAIGTIAQNPKDFGVNSEALKL